MRLRNSKPPSISKSAMNSASKTCLCEPSVSTYLTCLKSKTASLNCYGFGWSTPVSQSSLGWIRDMYQGPPRAFVALPNGRYFFALCTVAVHCTECQARTLTTMTLSWVHATNSFTPAEYTICPGDKSRFHCQMQSTHAEHQAITVRRLPIIPHHSKTGFPPPPQRCSRWHRGLFRAAGWALWGDTIVGQESLEKAKVTHQIHKRQK